MNEKIYNAIQDPKVMFFLFPTPKLKELIAAGIHPHIQGMTNDAKVALLEDKVLPVSKEDVLALVENRLPPAQQFLLTVGEVRVRGAVEIIANKNVQGT